MMRWEKKCISNKKVKGPEGEGQCEDGMLESQLTDGTRLVGKQRTRSALKWLLKIPETSREWVS